MKYGRQAEREARREAQARARAKAIAEQESLNREEREQLEKGIKASLQEVGIVLYAFVCGFAHESFTREQHRLHGVFHCPVIDLAFLISRESEGVRKGGG